MLSLKTLKKSVNTEISSFFLKKNFNLGLQLKHNDKADYKILLNRAFFICLSIYDDFTGKIFFQDYLMFSDTCS